MSGTTIGTLKVTGDVTFGGNLALLVNVNAAGETSSWLWVVRAKLAGGCRCGAERHLCALDPVHDFDGGRWLGWHHVQQRHQQSRLSHAVAQL